VEEEGWGGKGGGSVGRPQEDKFLATRMMIEQSTRLLFLSHCSKQKAQVKHQQT